MYKKFQVNRTKIKGGCQSETKAAQQHSCIDLTLNHIQFFKKSIKIRLLGKIRSQYGIGKYEPLFSCQLQKWNVHPLLQEEHRTVS